MGMAREWAARQETETSARDGARAGNRYRVKSQQNQASARTNSGRKFRPCNGACSTIGEFFAEGRRSVRSTP